MLNKLLNYLRAPAHSAAQAVQPAPPPRRHTPPGIPIYPPIDQGIALASQEEILETQANLIRRIKLLAGTNEADFELRYLSVIRRLADHIQLLPASETESHVGPGGLFRLCLELSFFTAQAAEGFVFTGRGTSEDRRREEPRWRYAAFLAGLSCELHRCVTNMTVVDQQGRVWPAFNQPIQAWLNDTGEDRYFVRWVGNTNRATATAGLLVDKVVSMQNLQFLQDGSPRIVPAMMDAIAGTRAAEKSPLSMVVDQVREKVLHRDKSVQPSNYGKLTIGSHLEPHLLDAMRQLVAAGKWKVNENKSRLWYSKDGLYLVWRLAAKEVIEQLSSSSLTGIPQDAQTLLEILLAAKVLINDKDGSPYWMIIPPGVKSELAAVKFSNPMTLFGTALDEIRPVDCLDGSEATSPAKTSSVEVKPVEDDARQTASLPAGASETQPTPNIEESPLATEPALKAGEAIPEANNAQEGAMMPTAVAALLKPATREVMNAILTEHLQRQNQPHVGKVEHGFAISIEYMAGFGVTLEDLLKNLQEAGWLYCPPEKPARKLHQVMLGNKKQNVIIIKTAMATDAGFFPA